MADPDWTTVVRPLVEALREWINNGRPDLYPETYAEVLNPLVALLPPVPQWEPDPDYLQRVATLMGVDIYAARDALIVLHDEGWGSDITPARSPLPTDWEPSEQDVTDFMKCWNYASGDRPEAKSALMNCHRNGWDARPSRIGGTP